MIKYSVIIPFHSNANLLSACLSALKLTLNMDESEIIVVDNNDHESQIPDYILSDPTFRIIHRKENLLYPKAVNLGAEYATGEYLLFCDADTVVTPGFQLALTDELTKSNIGYTSAKLINMQNNCLQEFGITNSFYNFPHPFSGRERNFKLVMETRYPMAACAACSSIKRTLFTDIGGFDNELVHSYSDIDLCLRLQDKGYATACIPTAIAYHQGGSTIGSGMSSSLKEDTKGIFMSKHPNVPVQITSFLQESCEYFSQKYKVTKKEYFIFDCSTIANPGLYTGVVKEYLKINYDGCYRKPYLHRDAHHIDFLNYIPHFIRSYRMPILYFVDRFTAFQGNVLWKYCRSDFDDIVVDRNANVELLSNII